MKGFLSTVLIICLSSSSALAIAKARASQQTYPATEEGASSEVINSAPGKAASRTSYDVVPSSQTEPFIRRLKLAEALLTRYGRAYDYRAMTVVELQKVLDKLDSDAQKQSSNRIRERQHEESIIRAQAAANNESTARVQESHNSIGAEAPEPAPAL
jgi:hypothetical protein